MLCFCHLGQASCPSCSVLAGCLIAMHALELAGWRWWWKCDPSIPCCRVLRCESCVFGLWNRPVGSECSRHPLSLGCKECAQVFLYLHATVRAVSVMSAVVVFEAANHTVQWYPPTHVSVLPDILTLSRWQSPRLCVRVCLDC